MTAPQASRVDLEQALTAWIEERRGTAIELLRDLVRTPSFSGQEGTAEDAGSAVGKLVRALSGRRSDVSTQLVREGSENVIEVLRGEGPRLLVLDAHTDIVPEGDREPWFGRDPFSGAEGTVDYLGNSQVKLTCDGESRVVGIRDRMDRAWQRRNHTRRPVMFGRGSFDNKGPVVSAAIAMGALAEVLPELGLSMAGSVVAGYTVDEEATCTGIRAMAGGPGSWLDRNGFLDRPAGPDGLLEGAWGIALEGSYGWCPVIGHRGAVRLKVATRGQSAHAATPELGVNAVLKMARALLALDENTDELINELQTRLDPSLLGPPSLAVGTTLVGGGVRSVAMEAAGPVVDRQGVNSIPNWCEATVDVRHPPSWDLSTEETACFVLEAIQRHLQRQLAPRGWFFEVDILPNGVTPSVALAPTFEEAADLPLVLLARRRAKDVLGAWPELETAPGGTNATFMVHDSRIQTLVELGPGGGLSHDANEFVELDDVVDGAKLLALLAIDLVGIRS